MKANSPWLRDRPVEKDTSQTQQHDICDDSTSILEQDTRESWQKSKGQ
jgi:hypothetical protein